MIITDYALSVINDSTYGIDYEIGGILGSRDGTTIDNIVIDSVNTVIRACSYYPNTLFLNQKIDEWQGCNIKFKGLFHTHFASVKSLSKGDINYIKLIMHSMPDYVDNLFFPVFVLPERELVCYIAEKIGKDIEIRYSKLEIINSK